MTIWVQLKFEGKNVQNSARFWTILDFDREYQAMD